MELKERIFSLASIKFVKEDEGICISDDWNPELDTEDCEGYPTSWSIRYDWDKVCKSDVIVLYTRNFDFNKSYNGDWPVFEYYLVTFVQGEIVVVKIDSLLENIKLVSPTEINAAFNNGAGAKRIRFFSAVPVTENDIDSNELININPYDQYNRQTWREEIDVLSAMLIGYDLKRWSLNKADPDYSTIKAVIDDCLEEFRQYIYGKVADYNNLKMEMQRQDEVINFFKAFPGADDYDIVSSPIGLPMPHLKIVSRLENRKGDLYIEKYIAPTKVAVIKFFEAIELMKSDKCNGNFSSMYFNLSRYGHMY